MKQKQRVYQNICHPCDRHNEQWEEICEICSAEQCHLCGGTLDGVLGKKAYCRKCGITITWRFVSNPNFLREVERVVCRTEKASK